MGWRGRRHSNRHSRLRGRRHTLQRQLFISFGVVIGVSVLASGLAWWALNSAQRTSPAGHLAGLRDFAAHRFASVWHDEPARRRLIADLARDMRVSVELRDADGQVLVAAERCRAHPWSVDVYMGSNQGRRGEKLGRATLCPQHRPAPWVPAVGLLVLGLALWWGAGLLARRLTRPLVHIADVARDIGDGDLTRRAKLGRYRGEIGALADAINEMAGRIEQQIGDQRELLAAVSHELRTPLGHMRILVEIAQESADPAAQLLALEAEISEMNALVGDLLASSRLDFSRLDRRLVKPAALAAQALERAGLSDALLEVESDVQVSAATSPDAGSPTPPDLLLDTTLMQRALANLLSNAAVHGGGVSRLVVVSEPDFVRFEVHDHGEGFAPEAREHLFAPFASGGAGRSTLGLGLSLVRRIAQAHGGSASARNLAGGGACFAIEVPRLTGEAAPSAGGSASA